MSCESIYMSHDLMTISAAARAVGVAPDTLRVYERRGIVSPVRDSSGRRLYAPADIEAARAHRAGTLHRAA